MGRGTTCTGTSAYLCECKIVKIDRTRWRETSVKALILCHPVQLTTSPFIFLLLALKVGVLLSPSVRGGRVMISDRRHCDRHPLLSLWISITVIVPFVFQPSFFLNARLQGLIETFVVEFFRLYDAVDPETTRQSLHAAYDEQAIFTLIIERLFDNTGYRNR